MSTLVVCTGTPKKRNTGDLLPLRLPVQQYPCCRYIYCNRKGKFRQTKCLYFFKCYWPEIKNDGRVFAITNFDEILSHASYRFIDRVILKHGRSSSSSCWEIRPLHQLLVTSDRGTMDLLCRKILALTTNVSWYISCIRKFRRYGISYRIFHAIHTTIANTHYTKLILTRYSVKSY